MDVWCSVLFWMLEILCNKCFVKRMTLPQSGWTLSILSFYLYFDGRLGASCLKKKLTLPLQFISAASNPFCFFFKINFMYLFICFWLHWVFVAACGFSLVAVSRGYSSLQCVGLSLRWLLLLQSTGSRRAGFSSCGSCALERRLSSCGTRA